MKILFLDGTDGYYPGRIYDKPSGGIITSLHHIPQYLAKQGHEVSLISVWEKGGTHEGVNHLVKSPDWEPDVVVFNRNLMNHAMVNRYKNAYKIWWLHDIVHPAHMEDDSYRRMDLIVALSNYCRDSYSDFYSLPLEKLVVIPNGVDKTVFYPGTEKREQGLLVYASAPIKGMYPLAYAFENVKRNFPKARLAMYSNQSMHEKENTSTMEAHFKQLKDMGAEVSDPIPQKELADVFRKAWALVMPNSYPEICSNILLQAMACGLPVIASNIGSASEFIQDGHNGFLTKWKPEDMFLWWKDYAAQCVGMTLSPELQAKTSKNAPVGIADWSDIGARWNQVVTQKFVEVS